MGKKYQHQLFKLVNLRKTVLVIGFLRERSCEEREQNGIHNNRELEMVCMLLTTE